MTRFTHFILLAGMRTGSNLAEAQLNSTPGITCHGEAFNPSFMGTPKSKDLLGVTMATRDADPHALLQRIKDSDGLGGFRFFHDHDPRILQDCLADPLCAKIILTRNPLHSFISWQIARTTGQWKLTNATHAKSVSVRFDAEAFGNHVTVIQQFHRLIDHALQTTGQTAFRLSYDDLADLNVINGLIGYLGVPARLDRLHRKLKRQNPQPLEQRVENHADMQRAIAALDPFDLWDSPQSEPSRGPAIPTYVAAPRSPLLYMPLRSGPDIAVQDWLRAVDGGADPITGLTRRTLRDWHVAHPMARRFTVVCHPLARAHAAFCDRILLAGPGHLPEIRANLIRVHKIDLPEPMVDLTACDAAAHKIQFAGFLRFLHANMAGQTNIRVDPNWASQSVLLQGIAQNGLPDLVAREDRLDDDLAYLAQAVGIKDCPPIGPTEHAWQHLLAEIYDQELDRMARRAYAQDYAAFGFPDWKKH